MPQTVEIYAPATIANLGPGFDIVGMAFEEPYDTIQAERSATPGVTIAAIHGDDGKLSLDPTRNTAGIAALHALKLLGNPDAGITMTIHKGLPLASGLGSSAASAAGGAAAVNALFDNRLRPADLLAAALEGEAAVSGRHADNVAPALFGGIILVGGLTIEQLTPLPIPNGLICVTVTPAVAVPTVEARAVLPQQIPLTQMVKQTAAVATMIAALYRNDIELLGKAMEMDGVIEPARQHLMPGLSEVRAIAKARGAFGTVISGAGPTLCSVCDSLATAQAVADAVALVYLRMNMPATVRITRPAREGIRTKVLV
jgi:homoserine kinase